ncbi:glycerophosphodiester phosphodiesterase family protein [Paenibacillus sp. GP183]|uniref:glycerophosphodiester phosphodiesterase n=1 Tax=Paenibacillus sp. GP183 TaxID=1882751 RepID=UPI0008980768|nr:glycerophosphodiester phosphodiesterase family protein [Paenibacillus sp. GP183]SEB53261.1 glycerophosphoryl diester phosphodiesterase [Paenibacillus sp. GP183]
MNHPFPIITAHSGCMNTLDNTLLSVETGLKLGADVIEEDIMVTKDGVPVLSHDDIWTTPAGWEYRISQSTFEEISLLQFEVKQGDHRETTRIYKLEEMLPLIQASGKIANLDLKDDQSIEPVAALLKKHGLLEQAFYSGCEKDRAMKAQQSNPEIRKMLNVDARNYLSMAYKDMVEQICQDALDAACYGINLHYLAVRPELVEYASSKGLPIYIWTVNEESLMKQYAEMGVASITTRNVLALVQLKQRMQR